MPGSAEMVKESSSDEKSRRSRQSEIADERRRSAPMIPPGKWETMAFTCWIWVRVDSRTERMPVDKPLEEAGGGEWVDLLGGGGDWRERIWGRRKKKMVRTAEVEDGMFMRWD